MTTNGLLSTLFYSKVAVGADTIGADTIDADTIDADSNFTFLNKNQASYYTQST